MLAFTQPLAVRMCPRHLSEIIGQDHLIGPGKMLTRMAESRRLSSIILYGAPGVGKTSIGYALSYELKIPFGYFNASVHTKKDLQDLKSKRQSSTLNKPKAKTFSNFSKQTKLNYTFYMC